MADPCILPLPRPGRRQPYRPLVGSARDVGGGPGTREYTPERGAAVRRRGRIVRPAYHEETIDATGRKVSVPCRQARNFATSMDHVAIALELVELELVEFLYETVDPSSVVDDDSFHGIIDAILQNL